MLPNDAHYNPNYILMLNSSASIHHWDEIQMLTIHILKKVCRTENRAYLSEQKKISWSKLRNTSKGEKKRNKQKFESRWKEKKSKGHPLNTSIGIHPFLGVAFVSLNFLAHKIFFASKY